MPPPSLTDTAHIQISSRARLGWALDASLRTGTGFAAALVTLGIMAAWLGTYVAGGTKSVLPQLFYLPIIFAAGRFGWPGAIATAGVAGVLAGPLVRSSYRAGKLYAQAARLRPPVS